MALAGWMLSTQPLRTALEYVRKLHLLSRGDLSAHLIGLTNELCRLPQAEEKQEKPWAGMGWGVSSDPSHPKNQTPSPALLISCHCSSLT